MSDVTILAGQVIEGPATTARPAKRYQMIPTRADLMPKGEILLPGVWKQLHDEEIFEMFFHDYPDMTFGQFVAVLSRPDESVEFVCEVDEAGNIVKAAAIAMLTQITKTATLNKAIGNFLLFRDYWNHHDSDEIGEVILRRWFVDMQLDVIVGVTPKANVAAIRFIRRVGFEQVGEIPRFCSYKGEVVPGVVSAQTFKEWDMRRQGMRTANE